MTAITRTNLYTFFQTNDRPTQSQFADLIDSSLNIADVSGQFITSDVSCGGAFSVSAGFSVLNSAQANFTGNTIVSGNLTVNGTANLTGITISGSANFQVGGELTVNGSATIASDLSVSGNSSLAGSLSVIGLTTLGTEIASSLTITTSGSPTSPSISIVGSAGIFSQGNNILAFSNGATETARINANGNLIVGATNDAPFTDAGLAAGRIVVDIGNSAQTNGIESSSGTTGFIPLSVGRQNSNPGSLIYFVYNSSNVGLISTDGSTTTYATTSDVRKKELVSPYDPNDLFDHLKVWNFNWKSNNRSDVGCTAQELYKLIPNAVSKGDDTAKDESETGFESWHISYPYLIPYLIAEIKSMRERINIIEGRVLS